MPLHPDTTTADHRVLLAAIEQALESNDFLSVLRLSARLARLAARTTEPDAVLADAVALDAGPDRSDLAALVAIEAASTLRSPRSGPLLVEHLGQPSNLVRRHAAWRLRTVEPQPAAIEPLLELLVAGGIDTMHSHRTLRAWAATEPNDIAHRVSTALDDIACPAERARVVDLLGVIEHPVRLRHLMEIADDDGESRSPRIAAIGALGTVRHERGAALLGSLATRDDDIGAHAALALDGLLVGDPTARRRPTDRLRIAQLVLAGSLDGQLSLGGRGDTGGVASLLVSLGEALVRRDDVDQVVTIGRGSAVDALTSDDPRSSGAHSFGTVTIDDLRGTGPTSWEHLPTLERGLRRQLRLAAPVDVLHLRMADVGTLAGASIARSEGLKICFSVAPDPHNVIGSLRSSGRLDADSFARLDLESDVWFRARLIEHVTRTADRLALFPRARPEALFTQLGIEPADATGRSAVVPEGVDVGLIRRAADRRRRRPVAPAGPRGGDQDILAELDRAIPCHRRGLPIVVSVGRLHPVKGMDRVAAAWATDPELRSSHNLVIVGGALDDPSPIEETVMAAIAEVVPDEARDGLVMLGGRPRSDVALLLTAVAGGFGDAWRGGGVYVDGALKEEFGLALLEALAAGLVVVAPSTGGPPTFVDDGHTGILVDPGCDLADGIRRAVELVDLPGRAGAAHDMVVRRYSIDTMADRLATLYASPARANAA